MFGDTVNGVGQAKQTRQRKGLLNFGQKLYQIRMQATVNLDYAKSAVERKSERDKEWLIAEAPHHYQHNGREMV